jgi:Family of unknown function (DUF6364)
MDTKLTLKLDESVIEKAKFYAKKQEKSLSKIVETFLESLVNTETEIIEKEIRITPFVKSLRTGATVSADLDYKKEYYEHLLEKHK